MYIERKLKLPSNDALILALIAGCHATVILPKSTMYKGITLPWLKQFGKIRRQNKKKKKNLEGLHQ